MASATPPNMAQIPLPPGFTLEQFMTLQGQLGWYSFTNHWNLWLNALLVTIAITVTVAFGVVLWD
jgi:hypothetical protein